MAASRNRLTRYREMRDFRHTPEPRGRVAAATERLYVVQKHAARRLHYDFRLALDGVLLSWAVPRGPSLNPAHRRLAVRTEDHPLAYGDFEGVIPSGYGAGTVLLWDRGRWQPSADPHRGLERGKLEFRLEGERLKGDFALVRMRGTADERRENWLLIKQRDAEADAQHDPVSIWEDSVLTGRDLAAIAALQPAARRPRRYTRVAASKTSKDARKTQRHAAPTFVSPQLATLRPGPPTGDDWLHEVKFDGYRIQALVENGAARLLTRNHQDWTERYRAVAQALAKLAVRSAVIDGEIVAFDSAGRAAFSALQNAAPDSRNLVYYGFDLMHLDGQDWRAHPLRERKAALQGLLRGAAPVLRFSEEIEGQGATVYAKACAMGLEGIVSKRADAPYRSGRGTLWIKSKCTGNEEFVIGGYRRSDVPGRPFASLLVGEYHDGRLAYRGRVGTGFDQAALDSLVQRFRGLERSTPPFHDLPADARRQAVWLEPRLVAQVRYAERTGDGRLRHPAYLGLREDKPAVEVRMPSAESGDDELVVNGVRLTHAGKIMYPRQGVTKRNLADYYNTHAERMLPFIAGRPISLVRCPEGRQGECFFQKHASGGLPAQLRTLAIPETTGSAKPYLMIRDAAGLVAAVQYGTLEFHLWGARADRIERPERLVFDLDPAEDVGFGTVREAAFELRGVLASAGLTSFALLTGGKGIHVVVPLSRRHEWSEVKAFARGLAAALAAAAPNRYVAQAAKHKRGGKIFIDWLRNARGATAIAPYSTRARAGAPIATPVSWEELPGIDSAAAFGLPQMGHRLARLSRDPWEGYFALRQSIAQRTLEHFARP